MSTGVKAVSRATRLATSSARAQDYGRLGQPIKSLECLRLAIQALDEAQPGSIPLHSTSASSFTSISAPAPVPAPSPPSSVPAPTASSSSLAAPLLSTAALTASPVSSPTSKPSSSSPASTRKAPPPAKDRRHVPLRPLELKHTSQRDEAEEMLQRAVTGVIQAYNNGGQPHAATAFASRALKLPNFLPAPTELSAPAKEAADLLPPTSVSTLHYKALLECAARKRSVVGARSILLDMLSRELPVNGRIRRGLSRLILSSVNQDTSHMLRMFRQILPKVRKRYVEADEAVDQRLTKLAEFLESLGLMDKVILQKPAIFSKAAQAADRNRSSREAMHRWMVDDQSALFEPPPPEYLDSLEEMMDLSKPLGSSAYAMRMRVFAVVRKDFESAQRLWRSMLDHGVSPNAKHVAPLIEGLLAVSRIDDAQKLKDNALRIYSIKPSLRIHTALIRAYTRAEDDRGLKRELKELKRNGYDIDDTILQIIEAALSNRTPLSVPIVPRRIDLCDVHSVSSRFQVHMRAKAYLEAQQLMARALDQGLVPDTFLAGLLKRSVNWLQKLPRNRAKQPRQAAAPTEQEVHDLEVTLKLAQQNLRRARKIKKLTPLEQMRSMRRFRRGVVELIFGIADGSLKREARRLAAVRTKAASSATRSSSLSSTASPEMKESRKTRTPRPSTVDK